MIINRNKTLAQIWETVNQKSRGHYNYYGVSDNWNKLTEFKRQLIRAMFYWLRRRSQRSKLNWDKINKLLIIYPLCNPKPGSLINLHSTFV